MDQATEQVSSMNAAYSVLINEPQCWGWIRRLELQRPVRPVAVVVLDVDSQNLLQVPATHNQQPVQTLGPHRPDPGARRSLSSRLSARSGLSRTGLVVTLHLHAIRCSQRRGR